jgi:hypothetical protein
VHRPLGEQHQDGGTDVTAAAASAVSAAPSTARPRAKPEAEAEPSRTETATEAGPEWPVVADVVAPEIVAEFAPGLLAVFMQGAPFLRVEAEPQGSGTAGERPVEVGEWVAHMLSRFWKGSAQCATDTATIYRKLS